MSPKPIDLTLVGLCLPFAGLLLSVAILPLARPHLWDRLFPATTAAWALAFVVPFTILRGPERAAEALVETLAQSYLPFVLLLLALFVVAGGIRLAGNLVGTPLTNLAILALGTGLASLLGTTGAAMLLIRPLIRANADRPRNTHVFVFFIFLVCNIGGALTPLGDPPLFLGFLRGVAFGWTARALGPPMILSAAVLLVLFYVIDARAWARAPVVMTSHMPRHVRIEGLHNVLLLAAVVAAVWASGVWPSGLGLPIGFGLAIPLESALRDAFLLVVALMSYLTTPARIRIENAFTWLPIREVAILFAGLFVTMIPLLEALQQGLSGPFAPLLRLVSHHDGTPIPAAYFWLAGGLSSVLDNAPTYLAFFDLAGGSAEQLMTRDAETLAALSCGAVFMGALTYLGNAPNVMVRTICSEQSIPMPSFFGYLGWSTVVLLPLFVAISFFFF